MTIRPQYVSDTTFPKIPWGYVAKQARNFTRIGQKTVIIAHTKQTIHTAMLNAGFGASVKETDIPYHFEVESIAKNTEYAKKQKVWNKNRYQKLRAVA